MNVHSLQNLACVLAVSACAGCAALGGYAPARPVHAMPGELRAGTDDAVTPLARVTARSGEGLTSARAVSLAEVLRAAHKDAVSVLESAARLEAAAGRVRAADGALWPGASVEVGADYLDGRQVGSFGGVQDVSFGRLEPAATIFYRVNPAAAVARSDARRRDAAAAAMDVSEAERAAMLQGAVAYYDLLLASAALDVATTLQRDAESFLAIARARAAAEVGAGGDVARTEAEAAAARESATRARGRWEEASIRLSVLLRWPTEQWLRSAETEVAPSVLLQARDIEALQRGASAARPDLEAAAIRARGAAAERRAAWWDLLGPEIDAGVRGRFLGTEPSELGGGVSTYAVVGWSFDFGELGRLAASAGEARAAALRATALKERVAGEVAAAASRARTARQTIADASARLDAAARNHRIQAARFEAGTGLGIEVIDAQNALARARLGLAEAVVRFNVAQVELAASAGHLTSELVDGGMRGRRQEQQQEEER